MLVESSLSVELNDTTALQILQVLLTSNFPTAVARDIDPQCLNDSQMLLSAFLAQQQWALISRLYICVHLHLLSFLIGIFFYFNSVWSLW